MWRTSRQFLLYNAESTHKPGHRCSLGKETSQVQFYPKQSISGLPCARILPSHHTDSTLFQHRYSSSIPCFQGGCSVTQSCPAVCDLMGCSPPGSFVHGISRARILEWVAILLLQGIFSTQGSTLCLLYWQADSLLLSHQGSPFLGLVQAKILETPGPQEAMYPPFYCS